MLIEEPGQNQRFQTEKMRFQRPKSMEQCIFDTNAGKQLS